MALVGVSVEKKQDTSLILVAEALARRHGNVEQTWAFHQHLAAISSGDMSNMSKNGCLFDQTC